MEYMNIILLGPPGTGKGTIAQFIEEKFGYTQVSTGDLLREEAKKNTELGKEALPYMKAGKLVPNPLVAKIVAKKLLETKSGVILDGYPRNIEQAKELEKILLQTNQKTHLALEIQTPDKEIIDRLSKRRQCTQCKAIFGRDVPPEKEGICNKCKGKLVQREDDKEEVIKKRLAEYAKNNKGLPEFYGQKKILKEIDGNRVLLEIFEEIQQIISKQKNQLLSSQ
jgi:adenylate kinase